MFSLENRREIGDVIAIATFKYLTSSGRSKPVFWSFRG